METMLNIPAEFIQSVNNFEREKKQTRKIRQETQQKPDQFLDELGNSIFIVDPRHQGLGLRDYKFLDAYANKFFILSGENGMFISPREIPGQLHDYYEGLGIDVASRKNVVSLDDTGNGQSLIHRVQNSPKAKDVLIDLNGKRIVPYMMTSEVEAFAEREGLTTFTDAQKTEQLANKARFREELDGIARDVLFETGIDIRVNAAIVKASERKSLEKSYRSLSKNGKKKVVAVNPLSASALGVFIIPKDMSVKGLNEIIDNHFPSGEEVLLSEYIDHQEAPSMQGGRLGEVPYGHFYLGRQLLEEVDGGVIYNGSQIPFGKRRVSIVSEKELAQMREIHRMLGDYLFSKTGIQGVAGFDTLLRFSEKGKIKNLKVTEMNLHLPSSLAVFAAIQKLFPEGFYGVAHNLNIPLRPGISPIEFIKDNYHLIVKQKESYGMFPLNLSYEDKVDVVIFGQGIDHVEFLRKGIISK